MQIDKILNSIYETKNEVELFDRICIPKHFLEKNSSEKFFEERSSEKGNKFFSVKTATIKK